MNMQARAWGIAPGRLSPGSTNTIMDVAEVSVGHVTLAEGRVQTGITAVLPHQRDLFLEKVPAAAHVINGFGKSSGLVQVQELGTLETPVVLCNTFSVGTVYQALVEAALLKNTEIGRSTGTVNPVVCECNDGVLNDIREFSIKPEHVHQAIAAVSEHAPLMQGAVGAGRGMSCYGMKGGIGSASRHFKLKNSDVSTKSEYTLGVLVLTNFGTLKDLRIEGRPVGEELARDPHIKKSLDSSRPVIPKSAQEQEHGSVIVLLATDAPLSSRQLGRVARRASAGLNRTGSFIAGGSGEIALAFSTAYTVPHFSSQTVLESRYVHEDFLDRFFLAAAESVEEAVLNSMITAEHVEGRDGHVRYSLADYLPALGYRRAKQD